MECDMCGELMLRKVKPEVFEYRGESISLDQPGWYCSKCKNAEFSLDDLKATDGDFMDFAKKVNLKKGNTKKVWKKNRKKG